MKRRHDPDISPTKNAPPQQTCSSPNDRSSNIDPTKKYARRPRRKTRHDRYEYKGAVPRASTSRQSKRMDHKKSWAVLNDEYQAPNVTSHRLTLRPGHGPGILANARASGSVQRQGVPDLTFSEMDFLKQKNKQDHGRRHRPERPVQKRQIHTAPNLNDEISNFFSRPPTEKRKAPSPKKPSHQQYATPSSSSMPMSNWYSRPADVESLWWPDKDLPMLKHFRPQSSHKTAPSQRHSADSRALWSRAPMANNNVSPVPQLKRAAHPHSWGKINSPLAREARHIDTSTSIDPHSSASNHFFKNYTTNALFSGVEAFAQKGHPYFSLGDLKNMANERILNDIPFNVSDSDPRHDHQRVRPHDFPTKTKDPMANGVGRQDTNPPQNEAHDGRRSVLFADCQKGRKSHSGNESVMQDQELESATKELDNHTPEDVPAAAPVAQNKIAPQYSSYWTSPHEKGTARLSGSPHIFHRQRAEIMKDENSLNHLPRPSSRTGSQILSHSSWWPTHGQHETSKTSATQLFSRISDQNVVTPVTRQDDLSLCEEVPDLRREPAYSDYWRPLSQHEASELPSRTHLEQQQDEHVENDRSFSPVKTGDVRRLDDLSDHEPFQFGQPPTVCDVEAEDPTNRYYDDLSDGLDDFDVQLLHMGPPSVSSRPPTATAEPRFCARLHEQQGCRDFEVEEQPQVRALFDAHSPSPSQAGAKRRSYDMPGVSYEPSSVFRRQAHCPLSETSHCTILPSQYIRNAPGFPGQNHEQPEQKPFAGFSRRYLLY